MLNIRRAKLFRRPNTLLMSIYLILFHQNMWIFIFWTPCLAKIAFYLLGLSIFEKKAPKMLNIRKAKLFRTPNILIMSIYLNFSTKMLGFSFSGHPVWLTQPFIGMVYLFLKKGSQNSQYQKGKTFQESHYFDQVHISHYFHPKYVDLHFLDTLYGYYSILLDWSIHFRKKAPKMLHIIKAKLFMRPYIMITTIYLIFSNKICGFSFFGPPVWLKLG